MLKTTASKSTTIKVLASTVLVGGAVSVAGLGTFGAFTSTTEATQAVDSGTITLSLNGTKEATEKLGSVGGMVPGDSFERKINLSRAADDELFGSLTITPTSVSTKGAGADLVKQIKAQVKSCSVPWDLTKASETAPQKLVCPAPGTVTDITTVTNLMQGAKLTPEQLADNLNSTRGELNLGVIFTFTSTGNNVADNKLQDAAADLSFTFTAEQRTATTL